MISFPLTSFNFKHFVMQLFLSVEDKYIYLKWKFNSVSLLHTNGMFHINMSFYKNKKYHIETCSFKKMMKERFQHPCFD